MHPRRSGYRTFVQATPSFDRNAKPSCDSASIQRLASASQPALAREIASTLPGPKSRPLTPATRCHVAPSRVVQIPRLRIGGRAEPADHPQGSVHDGPGFDLHAARRCGHRSPRLAIPGTDEPGGHVLVVVGEGALRPDGDEPLAHAPDVGHRGLSPDVLLGPSQDGGRVGAGEAVGTEVDDAASVSGSWSRPTSTGSVDDDRRDRHQDPPPNTATPTSASPMRTTMASDSRSRSTATRGRVAVVAPRVHAPARSGRHRPARGRRTCRGRRSGGLRSASSQSWSRSVLRRSRRRASRDRMPDADPPSWAAISVESSPAT